jgi:hypothetical protein
MFDVDRVSVDGEKQSDSSRRNGLSYIKTHPTNCKTMILFHHGDFSCPRFEFQIVATILSHSTVLLVAQHPLANLLALLVSGGKSTAGLPSKKPSGFKVNPVTSQGMTGKSSGRGTCATPNACHKTISSFSMLRLAAVQSGNPLLPFPCGVSKMANTGLDR